MEVGKMVKMLKRTGIAILIVCWLLLLAAACGVSAENDFVGNWSCVRVTQYTNAPKTRTGGSFPKVPDIDMTEAINDRSTIVIKNGGKATIKLKSDIIDQTIEGSWELDESAPSELKITDKDGNITIIYKEAENSLYIESRGDLIGYRYRFSRK